MSTRRDQRAADDIRRSTAYINARKMPIEAIRKELLDKGIDSRKEAEAMLDSIVKRDGGPKTADEKPKRKRTGV